MTETEQASRPKPPDFSRYVKVHKGIAGVPFLRVYEDGSMFYEPSSAPNVMTDAIGGEIWVPDPIPQVVTRATFRLRGGNTVTATRCDDGWEQVLFPGGPGLPIDLSDMEAYQPATWVDLW